MSQVDVNGVLLSTLQLMQNPDMLRQMMESPVMTQVMSNPDIMRQMIMANPQMRELMEVE